MAMLPEELGQNRAAAFIRIFFGTLDTDRASQTAYDLNTEAFDGSLTHVLVTLQRHAQGPRLFLPGAVHRAR